MTAYQSASRRPEASSGVSSTQSKADAEIAREIYRASEQEGWSKEKLFKMLADPSKFKKSSRYILNKKLDSHKLQSNTSPQGRESIVAPVVQRMLADQIEREERKRQMEEEQRKKENDLLQMQQANMVGSDERSTIMPETLSTAKKRNHSKSHRKFE